MGKQPGNTDPFGIRQGVRPEKWEHSRYPSRERHDRPRPSKTGTGRTAFAYNAGEPARFHRYRAVGRRLWSLTGITTKKSDERYSVRLLPKRKAICSRSKSRPPRSTVWYWATRLRVSSGKRAVSSLSVRSLRIRLSKSNPGSCCW